MEKGAYMTAPLGAVPAKMASSPIAKMAMNQTNPAALAGGNQKAATMAKNPTTALHPANICQDLTAVPNMYSPSAAKGCRNEWLTWPAQFKPDYSPDKPKRS